MLQPFCQWPWSEACFNIEKSGLWENTFLPLKSYYDQKIVFFFPSTGKILSFDFYPKAVYFECKVWISRSAISRIQNWLIRPQRVGFRESDTIYLLA